MADPARRRPVEPLPGEGEAEIRRLTGRRHDAYERARTYRRNGQLVPASLSDELTDNASHLRRALDEYAAERLSRPA